jgi:DNA-binding transcriptional regulator YiaG
MTFNVDSDYKAQTEAQTGRLPFSSSDAELAGIRVTRAQFARLMGVSKQAVTDWVKSGRIVLGADERFDPRQAVARLLATGDPARLRAKVLAPLTRDIAARDARIAVLEAELATIRDDAEFHEASAAEYLDVFEALVEHLAEAWDELRAAPAADGLAAVLAWLEHAQKFGTASVSIILEYLPVPASEEEEEGAGNAD